MKPWLYRYRRTLLCIITVIVYGGLAYLANHKYGIAVALKASIVQATVSMLLVWFSSLLMEFFFSLGDSLVAKYCSSLLFTGTIVFCINLFAHWVMHTPAMLQTLIYAVLTSLPYYVLYPYMLLRQHLTEQGEVSSDASYEKY